MAIIHYHNCPCCQSAAIQKKLEAGDYTVSHEIFEIWECADCSLRFTQDVPDLGDSGKYYQSDTYVSHTDTKKGIINRLYHLVRRRTLRQKRKLVQQITGLQKGSLLDIGAGTGAFAHEMQTAGWNVTGLEPDNATRVRAEQLHGVSLQPAESLFQPEMQSFSAITMWHVLEHVHALHDYIAQLNKLLQPGGKIFIAVPNYTSRDADIYSKYWAAYDVPRHLYHFSPAAMGKLLKQHGLTITSMKPMWFDSFYIAMLSEKYKNGYSNLVRAIWNGFRSNIKAMGDMGTCSSVIYIIEKIS